MRIARNPSRIGLMFAILGASALGPLPCADALAHELGKASAGETYGHVRGLGPAKAAGKGLLRVKLDDGRTVLTHGVDAEPPGRDPQAPAAAAAPTIGGPERQPVCASDYYQHVLYGYPADRQSRLADVKATILAEIRRMDAALNEEALASGGTGADYKVRCEGSGEVRVDFFQSTQANARTTFAGVVSAARAAGFAASNADYTIFFDSSAPNACGTGTFSPDQRLSAENVNNSGGDYAVVYSDCWTDRTAMHENGHNQGAVQYDAPYSTGDGAHCNDGHDVMCYSDGGDKDVGMTIFCTDKLRFDCRHDSYFDAAPESGEYLASNWNIGSPLNRFITFEAPAPPKAACEDGIDNDGDGAADYPADPGCAALTDGDEGDPAPPAATPAPTPAPPTGTGPYVAGLPTGFQPAPPPVLPTLSMSTARRYARARIKRKHPRASRMRARCSRRTRTSARCKVRWSVGTRAAYAGNMVVRYRRSGGAISLASSSRVRRIR